MQTEISADVPSWRVFKLSCEKRLRDLAEEARGTANVAAAEDVILAKLEWYRLGGESSTRQWEDVLGVQGKRLNRDYLAQMSAELGVADLLQRAESEAR